MQRFQHFKFYFFQDQDSGRYAEAPITKCDSGTQTDTHFMESNIVKSYEWNEWELRRKAIKLVRGNLYSPVVFALVFTQGGCCGEIVDCIYVHDQLLSLTSTLKILAFLFMCFRLT